MVDWSLKYAYFLTQGFFFCFCPGEVLADVPREECTRVLDATLFVFMKTWKQLKVHLQENNQTMIQTKCIGFPALL